MAFVASVIPKDGMVIIHTYKGIGIMCYFPSKHGADRYITEVLIFVFHNGLLFVGNCFANSNSMQAILAMGRT
jgi:hypothetical protein